MFVVKKSIEIDAGHRVPFHGSQCKRLHGHRWKITAVVSAQDLVPAETRREDAGMVVDFSKVKQILMASVHAGYDHCFLLWQKDPLLEAPGFTDALMNAGIAGGIVLLPCIPTAEELAQYWGRQVDPLLRTEGLELEEMEVWETPTSVAVWRPHVAMQPRALRVRGGAA